MSSQWPSLFHYICSEYKSRYHPRPRIVLFVFSAGIWRDVIKEKWKEKEGAYAALNLFIGEVCGSEV